jgi:hypothetical protein
MMQLKKIVRTDTKTECQTPPSRLDRCRLSVEANPNPAHFQLHVVLAQELLECEWPSHDGSEQRLPLEVLHPHAYIDIHPDDNVLENRTLEHDL